LTGGKRGKRKQFSVGKFSVKENGNQAQVKTNIYRFLTVLEIEPRQFFPGKDHVIK